VLRSAIGSSYDERVCVVEAVEGDRIVVELRRRVGVGAGRSREQRQRHGRQRCAPSRRNGDQSAPLDEAEDVLGDRLAHGVFLVPSHLPPDSHDPLALGVELVRVGNDLPVLGEYHIPHNGDLGREDDDARAHFAQVLVDLLLGAAVPEVSSALEWGRASREHAPLAGTPLSE
jgi:hypothetical protein